MTDYIDAYENPGCCYHREAVRLADKLTNDTAIADHVIRWNSNNAVPPAECVDLAVWLGLPVDRDACTAARTADLDHFIAEYKRATRGPICAEQRAEARAAFGPGQTVVNVITGRRFRT